MWFRKSRLEKILSKSSAREVFFDLSHYLEKRLSNGDNVGIVGQQAIDLYWFITEVANGGFSQFMCNSSGDHFENVVAFLYQLGFSDLAAQLERASETIFGSSTPPIDRDIRAGTFLRFVENNPEIESEFSEISNETDGSFIPLAEKIAAFAREHRDQLLA